MGIVFRKRTSAFYTGSRIDTDVRIAKDGGVEKPCRVFALQKLEVHKCTGGTLMNRNVRIPKMHWHMMDGKWRHPRQGCSSKIGTDVNF